MVQEDIEERLAQDFQRLPRTELIKIILQQQLRLKTLQTALHRLEQPQSRQEVSSPPPLNEQKTKMERAIRNALRFLNDASYLDHCPLIRVLAEGRQIKVDGRGLQYLLNGAIERLKPCPGQPGYHKWRIRYEILRLTYREQQPPQTVAAALALSERQYYRELKEAIEEIINKF